MSVLDKFCLRGGRSPESQLEVSLFVPSLRGGGAERVMLNLATALTELDVRTELVVANAKGTLAHDVPDKVTLVNLGKERTVSCIPSLVRYLRVKRPTVLLSTMVHANIVSLLAWRLARTETRVFIREATTHSQERLRARTRIAKLVFRLVPLVYPLSDGVIAPSMGAAQDLQQFIPDTEIAVITNPVITPELLREQHEPVEHSFFEAGVPVFLAAGRLTEAKDYPTLVRAFAEVRKKTDARLIILGTGEEHEALTSLIAALDLEPYVSLPGFVSNPFAFMRRCSVFVLSSRWEGLPNVLIQALACGTRVVSTDCDSGPREILDNGRLGCLVPVGDVNALAQAMITGLNAPPNDNLQDELLPFHVESVAREYYRHMLFTTSDATLRTKPGT